MATIDTSTEAGQPTSADPTATGTTTSKQQADVEEQQKLAQGWQPDVDGPYLGDAKQLEDILIEFEIADPRCKKIENLAKEFPYFRRMKGDGNCGYRALFFGFLLNLCEAALEGGYDPSDFIAVMDRHVQAMKDRGFTEMIFEDWVETTMKTLEMLTDALRRGEGQDKAKTKAAIAEKLTAAFNDDEGNSELIQYMRMATSSWLTIVNPDSVAPFLEDGVGIQEWCNRFVDPVAAELEDLSMKGVFGAFMEQVGMNLLIHDLEKGAGDEVPVYEHEATLDMHKSKQPKMPALHVLYRPGHYDLLLRESWA